MKKRTTSFLDTAFFWSVIFIPIIMGTIILLYFKTRVDVDVLQTIKSSNFILIFGFIILGFIVHELIHGLCFAKFAKGGFKTIKFGIMWKYMTPYCHCKEPIAVWQYRIVALMPTVILGFIPVILGFVISNFPLVFVGAMMISGGIGDFISFWMCRNLDRGTIIRDNPNQIGFSYENGDTATENEIVEKKETNLTKIVLMLFLIGAIMGAILKFYIRK